MLQVLNIMYKFLQLKHQGWKFLTGAAIQKKLNRFRHRFNSLSLQMQPRGFWCDRSWLSFLVPPTSLYCAQGCTQYIWPCIVLKSHCCVSQCTRSLRACCSRWWYVPRSLHVVCTTCIWDLAQCGRSRVPLPWCCLYRVIDMCGPCLDLWPIFVPGTMQRLLIPSCSFIWLFPGGYEALA